MQTVTYFISLLILISIPAFGQIKIFADFSNGGQAVPTLGDSADTNHVDWIDIRSMEAGAEVPISISSVSSGGGSGKTGFHTLILNKEVDKATPMLMASMAAGEHYENVVIEVTNSSNTSNVVIKYELLVAFVSEVSNSADDGAGSVTEQVSLEYGAHRITTYGFDQVGGTNFVSGTHAWSVVLNQAVFAVE